MIGATNSLRMAHFRIPIILPRIPSLIFLGEVFFLLVHCAISTIYNYYVTFNPVFSFRYVHNRYLLQPVIFPIPI